MGEKGHGPVGKKTDIKEEESPSEREEYTPEKNPSVSPITESEKNTDEQADQGNVDVEMPIYGEDAASAVLLALRHESRYKASNGTKTGIREALAEKALYQSAIDRVVPRFVEWAKRKSPPASALLLCHAPWIGMMEEPPEASLDVDSVVARVERRMNGASNEMSRSLDKLISPQFPRAAAPPADGIEWVGDLPEFAVRWNTVVKSGPPVVIWDRTGWDHKNLLACAANKGFTERLDEALAKCESILAVGNPLSAHVTFGWLIKPGNYQKPINGDLGYAAKPEKIAGREVAPPPKPMPQDFKLKRVSVPRKELGAL